MSPASIPPFPPILRVPSVSSAPSASSASHEASTSSQPNASELLISKYVNGLPGQNMPRTSHSVERLSGFLLAAIAWADRNTRGAHEGEEERVKEELTQLLSDASWREDLSEDGTSESLTSEIVQALRHSDADGQPSSTAIALTKSVLKAAGKADVDAERLLQEMERKVLTIAKEDLICPQDIYALTAWVDLGPPEEAPSRAAAAQAIFESPFSINLSGMGLKSMPVLPKHTEDLDLSDNNLTSLLGVPRNFRGELDATGNPVTTLSTTILGLSARSISLDDGCLSKEALRDLHRAMREYRVVPKIIFYSDGSSMWTTRGIPLPDSAFQ